MAFLFFIGTVVAYIKIWRLKNLEIVSEYVGY